MRLIGSVRDYVVGIQAQVEKEGKDWSLLQFICLDESCGKLRGEGSKGLLLATAGVNFTTV